ncbi:MAG: GNAT family N-acetyltransferase [Phycisphaeraceae bacterium]|nr:GNAT family N-acetyltransferase [Phycisphaerales bacterium]MCB9859165.1 GNAT family N-acetyltransferase [Phycisphaeraceae bacterium]
MIRIEHISPDHPLYHQQTQLREQVLLMPIGYSFARFRDEYAAVDDAGMHVVAVLDHPTGPKIIGTATLVVSGDDPTMGKLTQMAVDPQRQREGVGRRLVTAIESLAFGELGMREIYCHAQTTASGFYTSLGWQQQGDEFTEAGIQHVRMHFVPHGE